MEDATFSISILQRDLSQGGNITVEDAWCLNRVHNLSYCVCVRVFVWVCGGLRPH